ncbi:MAG: hypothetical protein P8M18_10735 [Woeseiaceae bacterium]|nr:hypothetical protein [Woeseiaceae bacterium]
MTKQRTLMLFAFLLSACGPAYRNITVAEAQSARDDRVTDAE